MAAIVWHPQAERRVLEDAGPFSGGGRKLIVHTTEGPTLEGAFETRDVNRDAAHFILEVLHGRRRLVQCIPIDRAARALEHPSGTPETNHANCIQVEVVGFTDGNQARALGHPELFVENWEPAIYHYLHLLAQWLHKHFEVPMQAPVPFMGQHGYRRLGGPEFFDAAGIFGHCHAAHNSHTDPGPLRAQKVLNDPMAAGHPAHA